MKWALVSEWLVEDPWQFVREVVERDWVEWRERERRVWEGGLGRRPNDAGDLCGSRMGKWASRLLPKVFFGLS